MTHASEIEALAGLTDTELRAIAEAGRAFRDALAAMPLGQVRLANGQQFNAYESAANDEDDDPSDWEFFLSLGPITDCVQIMGIEGEWRAKLVEAALRVAMRFDPALLDRLAALEAHKFKGDQSDLRLRFNEAIAGGPNMNGDAGWIIHTNGHAGDMEQAIARIAALEAERAADKARIARLEEALRPSGETKAAYMGEFYWIDDLEYEGTCQGRKVFVPWTTIKEIMAAIRARAALADERTGTCPHGSRGPCSVCGDEG